MLCPKCGAKVADHERHCPGCQHDCGYPNVRAAEAPKEVAALAARLSKAATDAESRACRAVLDEFRRSVLDSQAVMCRNLSDVKAWVSSDNRLYVNYYRQVSSGARRPEQTAIELQRKTAEEFVFPNYREEICFAALSLNGRGIRRYGVCSLTLREAHIRDRSTVFEENVLFFALKRNMGMKRHTVPSGYRATWDRRDQLAAAKLEGLLQPGTMAGSFPDILLKEGADSADDRFVEVHIYGPLHRSSIARLVAPTPKRAADRAILKEIASDLRPLGAIVEEY